jgi:hypothetical protein
LFGGVLSLCVGLGLQRMPKTHDNKHMHDNEQAVRTMTSTCTLRLSTRPRLWIPRAGQGGRAGQTRQVPHHLFGGFLEVLDVHVAVPISLKRFTLAFQLRTCQAGRKRGISPAFGPRVRAVADFRGA